MRKLTMALIALTTISLAAGAQEAVSVKWYSLEEALALNAQHPRKILIDIYTDWCGWCKTMDKNTFSNPRIAKLLGESFYPVKFNAESTQDVAYKGQIFRNKGEGQRAAHDFAVALLQGKLSYPSTVFLDSTSTPITFLSGYLGPEQLEPILVFIGESRYKTEKWEEFRSKFVSKLP